MSLVPLSRLLVLSALILLIPLYMIAAVSPVSAQSKDAWGAIYYSPGVGGEFGSSWDIKSQDEANRVAKQDCRKNGGRNCEFAVEIQTNECGALAHGPDSWGADYGPNENAATKKALQQCRKQGGQCKVIAIVCNNSSSRTAAPSTTPQPTCSAGYAFSQGRCVPTAAPRAAPTNAPPLATLLQKELKRLGCLTGVVDGIWGGGSRAALNRFSSQAGLRLGGEPSQTALDEARRTEAGFCQPVRAAPRRKKPKKTAKPKGCRSGTVFLEGQCIPNSEVASFCGPGFTRSGSKCVSMAGREEQVARCNSKDYAFCKPRAREYCEGDGSNSCINRETKMCLREEIGCTP